MGNVIPLRQGELQVPATASRYAGNGTKEKLLGAVYTPARAAAAMTRWAVRSAKDKVLDPSCGDGVFLAAAHTRLGDLGARRPSVQGVDIDPVAASGIGADCADFFEWSRRADPVDVVLGNPPYIRSHLFSETSRALAFSQLARLSIKPSRLMSTWAPFLAISCSLLSAGGRLAMVIPEELLTVGYAAPIRHYLLRRFKRVIVCFPPAGLFPSVQQATVLLLCDDLEGGDQGLLTLGYEHLESGDYELTEPAAAASGLDKWSHLFLSVAQRLTVAQMHARLPWQPLSHYGRVEVGIVTGENGFFVVDRSVAETLRPAPLIPVLSSARGLDGISFHAGDFIKLRDAGRPAYLLHLQKGSDVSSLPTLRAYLEKGESTGVSQRYKCRVREPWYAVPGVKRTHAVMLRQIGDLPRIINVGLNCDATDTLHRITWTRAEDGPTHAAGFLNTWTLTAAELLGRSYGGGVLELMPGEANRMPMPAPTEQVSSLVDHVDRLVRDKRAELAVQLIDRNVLKVLSKAERDTLVEARESLVSRRKTRG